MAKHKRFFIDVTSTYFQGEAGGIPRVVRKYAETLEFEPDLEVICFVHAGTAFYVVPSQAIARPRRLARSVKRLRAALRIRNYRFAPLYTVALALWEGWNAALLRLCRLAGTVRVIDAFAAGDTILLPYVPRRRSFARLMERRNRGALVAAMVHDLFPLQYPQFFLPEFRAIFEHGLAAQISVSDIVIAVSGRTAASVSRYLAERGVRKAVHCVHLGSDVQAQDDRPTGGEGATTLLSIGTLEPRKNHVFALALCDRLWAMGHDFRYVIVGSPDPSWSTIAATIHSHPEFGRRLFHHAAASDSELMATYRSSSFLLAASIDEGFGLPVMEAWRYGVPVICSDIATFRELCPGAHFIPLGDLTAAAARVAPLLGQAGEARRAARALPKPKALITWKDSARRIRAVVAAERDDASEVRDHSAAAVSIAG